MDQMIEEKVKTIDTLVKIIADLKKKGKKVIHCHGVFDLLHPGHLRHFQAAKEKGDILVVTITPDEYVNKGPGRPIFNQKLRAESIAAIECVDFVAVNRWPTAVEAIRLLKPDVYAKGREYFHRGDDITGKIYEEEECVKSVGGVIYFTDEISFSSTNLINLHFNVFPDETKEYLDRFKKRHSAHSIIGYLKKIKNMKILVIGDAIIDEYHYCMAMGKSQKDDIIAAKYAHREVFNGGALAVASHAANFCDNVYLITVLGKENSYEDFIRQSLKKNLKYKFFMRDNAPTVVKRRFLDPSFLNKMLEIYYINDNRIDDSLEKKINLYLNECIGDYDLVIAADFGHGLITDNLIKTLCEKSRFLAVTAQTNSANRGFNLVIKYPRADYICIDEPELRLAIHDRFSDLRDVIRELTKEVNCGHIVITRGHHGSMGYFTKKGFISVPVFSEEVLDRMGAGDAFLSLTSPLACLGCPFDVINFTGNAVGALEVLIVGNRSFMEPAPLYKYITTLLK
ncbi:MAG TPA: cytidyltransferase [Candidatus Scalindua sp.]|nr:cytidyltransferase [Candidatus Scalindua sp.]